MRAPIHSRIAYIEGRSDALSKYASMLGMDLTPQQRAANAVIQGASSLALNAVAAPHGEKLRQGLIGGVSDAAAGAIGGIPGMFLSPLINAQLQSLTAPKHHYPEEFERMAEYAKHADHADDRLKERIRAELPDDALEQLRSQARSL